MSSEDYRRQIETLIDLDEDGLLLRLADEVALGIGPLDPERKRSVARAWMDARRERLRLAICGSPRVRALRESADDSRLELAAAIADLIASVTESPAAATVAVLLVRTGVDELCG